MTIEKNRWKRPETLGLAERLKEASARFRECYPRLLEVQAEALTHMAKSILKIHETKNETDLQIDEGEK